MRADHGVLVERVVVVMPGPGALQLQLLHRGYAMRQHRPHDLLEQRIVDVEIGRARIGVFRRRHAADVDLALGPIPHAGRIDHQRHAGSAARHATTNTQRLRGSTGSLTPASAATSPACGPAALTSVPQPIWRPSASVTPLNARAVAQMPVTSPWM
jgi:hypothetical protein